MTVHLLRMAVGVDDIAHLRRVQKARRAASADGALYTYTRNTPRRADELIDGGSIYWIVKGFIRVRQRVVGVERHTDDEGRGYCMISIEPKLVPTVLQARRPQQGWRYLDPAEAPDDRPSGPAAADDMPPEMAAELRDLGLL
jgi:hypothetical protein